MARLNAEVLTIDGRAAALTVLAEAPEGALERLAVFALAGG